MPPLGIFPEGTSTNGKYGLLNFKKGAFKDLKPMKITGVKFSNGDWLSPMDNQLGSFPMVLMIMSNWYNKATYYEIDQVYDPKYLNIDPNDKNGWKIYAEKVRDIMAKMLDLKKIDMTWSHKNKFCEILKEGYKGKKTKQE